ncbi:MAG: hypothetical protein ABW007_03485, partial [Chitinophagaceae bacterium]
MALARYITFISFLLLFLFQAAPTCFAQMGFSFDIDKPKEFENRKLKSEKTPTDKKIKAPRRFIQNTVTHYN